jgi:hypothetical protein
MAFKAPDYTSIFNSVNKDLKEYYSKLLEIEKGDVDKAKRRLEEDYARGKRINLEDYALEKGFATKSAEASRRESEQQLEDVLQSLGYQRETLGTQRQREERQLLGDLLSRGISQGGLAEQKEQSLADRFQRELGYLGKQEESAKSKSELRREAIDRALQKTEKTLEYGKERGLEEEGLTKTRGLEDLETSFAKYKLQQQQEREEKAEQMASGRFQRKLGAKQAKESFRLQEKGLDLQQQSLDKM